MRLILLFGLFFALLAGCVSKKDLAGEMREAIKRDPTIITEAFKEHPKEMLDAISSLASARREIEQEKEAEARKKEYEEPKNPLIRPDESIRGTKGAPLVLVEYSDFQCSYCARGFKTVQSLLKKYEGKIQFIYKHLLLSFPHSKMASQYYEAIRLQDEKKAFKFHDEIFNNQRKLQKGESFLKSLAKKVNADMNRLSKDIKSSKVAERIEQDVKEAAEMGFRGTPGFLINGVTIKGAYPPEAFDKIVNDLVEMGKITL